MKILDKLLTPLLLAALTTSFTANAQSLYRYKNDKGIKVISSQIPARYVSKGYEVLAPDGKVIKVVAPEPSPEEKVRIEKELAEKKRLADWDRGLLKRYSAETDIEAAKQRKLSQLEAEISIRQRNIEKINSDIDKKQALAAEQERGGQAVPDSILEEITLLREKRRLENEKIRLLKQQQVEITESYNKDIERFRLIKPSRQWLESIRLPYMPRARIDHINFGAAALYRFSLGI